jgi:hypothetical protein
MFAHLGASVLGKPSYDMTHMLNNYFIWNKIQLINATKKIINLKVITVKYEKEKPQSNAETGENQQTVRHDNIVHNLYG